MKKNLLLKIGGVLFALILLFGALGAWIAPSYLKAMVEQKVGEALGRKVTLGRVDISPYALRVVLEGFTIHAATPGAPLLAVERIDAALGWATFARMAPSIAHLEVRGPKLTAARLEANRYDFSDIVERLMAAPKSGKAPTPIVLNRFSLEDASIDFDDRPERTRHAIRELRLVVPFVSTRDTAKNDPVQPVLSAKINGMALDLGGRLTPFADAAGASLKIDFKDFDLTRYVEYVPFPLAVRLASGMAEGDLSLEAVNDKDKGLRLTLRGQTALRNLEIRELSGTPMIALRQAQLKLAELSPLARVFNLESLQLEGLEVRVRRTASGLNLQALRPTASAAKTAEPAPASTSVAPLQFELAAFALKEARIEFADDTVTPAFRTQLEGIELEAKGLSSLADAAAALEARFTTRAGEKFSLSAAGTLQPLALEGKGQLAGVRLANYAAYLAPHFNGKLDGGLDLASGFRVMAEANAALKVSLQAPVVRMDKLVLAAQGTGIARLASAEVKAAEIDLEKRLVSAVEILLDDGRLDARREADGSLSLAKLVPPQQAAVAESGPGKALQTPATKPDEPKVAEPASWRVDLKQARIERFALRFEDAVPVPPVRVELDSISANASGLSTQPGVQGRMAVKLGVNRSGNVELSGAMSLAPLAAKLDLDARDLGIVPFQPYFKPFLNALVTAGGISAKGVLDITEGRDGISAGYSGEAGVGGFTLMDAAAAEQLVGFKALRFEQVEAASRPFALAIGQISLSEFFARLVVQPGGRINLQDVVPARDKPVAEQNAPGTPVAAKTAAAKPASSGGDSTQATAPIKIGRATLQGGVIEFSDRNLKPNFSAKLTDLAGRVSGLSPDPASRAEVELKGQVDGIAPLDIGGRINPLAGDLFLDIKASAKGIDLNPMTPYAAKYVGYGIEKGKLSLDLAYKIEKGRLDAQNRVFLDQLTFGERVESPDAIKAPVLLAVALLKNSRGEIDINLPIGGTLSDPQFSVGGIVVQLIINIIVKAVTAPFALLASLFGGGEELSFLEFAPGLAAIGAVEEGRLNNLAKALNDRAGLRLEMAGRVDAERDRDGLKRAALEQKVRAQKVAATVGGGADVKAAGDVTVTAAEYPVFLKRAYDRETFAKPRNAIGLVRDLPVPEMEALMLTHAEVGEQQLRELARRRAETVRDWFLSKGGIAAERVFLVEPREEDSDKEARAKARASRVDMYIK